MSSRAKVVSEALTWLRTPYHHRARVKGAGVDCANLPAAVYEAAGLIDFLSPEYSPQWMLHRDEELFLEYIRERSREIESEQVGPGDLIIWKFGRTFSHSAIVIDYPRVIHALNGVGVTWGDACRDSLLADREKKFFTLWDTDS